MPLEYLKMCREQGAGSNGNAETTTRQLSKKNELVGEKKRSKWEMVQPLSRSSKDLQELQAHASNTKQGDKVWHVLGTEADALCRVVGCPFVVRPLRRRGRRAVLKHQKTSFRLCGVIRPDTELGHLRDEMTCARQASHGKPRTSQAQA